MGKPLEKKYSREDLRIATFRITHGQWVDFQAKCDEQGKSASEAITAFIDSVIGGDSIPESKGNFPDIASMVREQVNAAIANLPKPEPVTSEEQLKGMIQAAIASEIQKSMAFTSESPSTDSNFATKNDLAELEETLLSLLDEKQTTPIKEEFNPDSPGSYNQDTLTTTEPIEVKEGELKSYEESVNYIIELNRQKTTQKKIAEMLNNGNYPTKSGSGQWGQTMVSGVITSREVKFTPKN